MLWVEMNQACTFCGNSDPQLWMTINQQQVCRACLPYRRPPLGISAQISPKSHPLRLHFPLTPQQLKIAEHLVHVAQSKECILLHAICGAGKTEMVSLAIADTLKRGGRVGFAIPRQALVRDIAYRLSHLFPLTQVVAVYGGHHDHLIGDIIVFTTHQAGRYPKAFELLIIDEVDAFPYVNHPVLIRLTEKTTAGALIQLSATPSQCLIVNNHRLILEQRPHGHPQVVPQCLIGNIYTRLGMLFRALLRWRGRFPVLMYVPSLAQAHHWFRVLKHWLPNVVLFHAGHADLHQLPQLLHDKVNFVAITTTVMERGITIPRVRVVVWDAHHRLFTSATLIQIAGRVGRSSIDFGGETLLIAAHETKEIDICISTISKQNQSLVDSVEKPSLLSNIPSSYFNFLP